MLSRVLQRHLQYPTNTHSPPPQLHKYALFPCSIYAPPSSSPSLLPPPTHTPLPPRQSEDPANENGGALKLRQELTASPYSKYAMDFLWEAVVAACIGNVLSDDPELVTGCRIADKGKKERGKEAYLLELWLRDSDRAKTEDVKAKLQAYLQDALAAAMIPESGNPVFDFKAWKDTSW